jgi:hypothetical protein
VQENKDRRILENPAWSPPKPPGTSPILFLSLLENNGRSIKKQDI